MENITSSPTDYTPSTEWESIAGLSTTLAPEVESRKDDWAQAYEIAKKKLGEDHKILCEFTNASRQSVTEAVKKAQESRRKKHLNGFFYGETYGRFSKSLETYAGIGNIMFQHNPHISALAWGTFRVILQVCHLL